MEDEELLRQKDAPEFYEDTVEYQKELEIRRKRGDPTAPPDMFVPPGLEPLDEEKSTNSQNSEEQAEEDAKTNSEHSQKSNY